MSGQTIALVTGTNKGIGYEIAVADAAARPHPTRTTSLIRQLGPAQVFD